MEEKERRGDCRSADNVRCRKADVVRTPAIAPPLVRLPSATQSWEQLPSLSRHSDGGARLLLHQSISDRTQSAPIPSDVLLNSSNLAASRPQVLMLMSGK